MLEGGVRMFCSNCGHKAEGVEKFCSQCGTPLEAGAVVGRGFIVAEKFEFKDLLKLEVMLFPKIATISYLVIVGISILFGFVTLIRGIEAPWGGGAMIISGLAMMTIVPLLIRLWFEFMLVLFMIHDKLGDVRGKLMKSTDT
jgi:hypothetical protein